MYKVFKAEIKKMVSKPGIYVLAILLAVILVLGVFIYKPSVTPATNQIDFANKSALDNYTYFMGGIKTKADDSITLAIRNIDNYEINDKSYKEYINIQVSAFDDAFKNYLAYAYMAESDKNETTKVNRRNAVTTALTSLYDTINHGLELIKNGAYPILTSTDNQKTLDSVYLSALTLLKTDTNEIANICDEFNKKYKEPLFNAIDNLIYTKLADNLIRTYTTKEEKTKYSTLTSRLNKKMEEIDKFYNFCKEADHSIKSENISKMANLCQEYVDICDAYSTLIHLELLSNAFSFVNTKEQLNLLGLKNESEYNSNTKLILYSYLFDNDKTTADYANPLTIGITSNHSINTYDYTYFILRLFSFIIIAYAVMTSCHSIAGEIKEGSMRYFAIRPVSRNNVFMGKLFAIMFMSTIMTLFAGIISLCVGAAFYGVSSLNILTIFNSSIAIVIHPIGMILIYILSLLLEILVYVSIAMLLATLLKSDLFAVTIVLVIYLVNTLLPMFAGGINSWLSFYPFSHISLYALFGSSIYAPANDFFNVILGAKVFAGTNIVLTVCIIVLIVLVLNVISTQIFKKKEL